MVHFVLLGTLLSLMVLKSTLWYSTVFYSTVVFIMAIHDILWYLLFVGT